MFHAALTRAPEARGSFLDEASGDNDALRREIDSLLAANEETGGFLSSPIGLDTAGAVSRIWYGPVRCGAASEVPATSILASLQHPHAREDPGELPRRGQTPAQVGEPVRVERHVAAQRVSLHQPRYELARRLVPPQHVGAVVAVDVDDRGRQPLRVGRIGGIQELAVEKLHALHEPARTVAAEGHFARCRGALGQVPKATRAAAGVP